ncbi:hypothetical protein J2Z31_002394 [Sinorhizobium kostiense]|uniref:Transposase n=1 Tax=Sinorhizobium kostiense TaxID=76747 RepID=A0ABS4QZ34_9HYPH|nr:hypothetical protein [Sinorhizobium kostiense]
MRQIKALYGTPPHVRSQHVERARRSGKKAAASSNPEGAADFAPDGVDKFCKFYSKPSTTQVMRS